MAHENSKMKTLPGVYRNKKRSHPLTVRPSSRQFNPHGRIMGLEEYRVIMGFPKTFRIYFDKANPTYWLNKGRNTLTKGSVYEVGLWLKRCLKRPLFYDDSPSYMRVIIIYLKQYIIIYTRV